METKTMIDKSLGELVFKYGWIRNDRMPWGGREVFLRVKFKATPEQNISAYQRGIFNEFIQNKKHYEDIMVAELQNFCSRNYIKSISKDTLVLEVIPSTLLIFQEGKWGITFKCPWEQEFLLAVKFEGTTVECGLDDVLL